VTRALLASGVAALTLLAGCGGEDEPPATQWADGLCSAITDWRTSVDETIDGLREGATMEDDLRAAAEDIEEATRGLADDLRGLGPPETESGAQADETLDELAQAVDDDLETVRSAVEDVTGLSDVLAAASAVTTALSALQQELTSTVTELRELDPAGELEEGFRDADSCAGLRDGG
jgi:methyl-accepting chemotaxis protein